MRYLYQSDRSLPGDLLLTMATLSGAWAFRSENDVGSLKPGKFADLAVVPLPESEDRDPHQMLLESDSPVVATMIGGTFVTGPWRGPTL